MARFRSSTVGGHPKIPVVIVDFFLEKFDAVPGTFEAAVASHDADVVPHESPDLVPVLGDDDGFVAIRGVSLVPDRYVAGVRRDPKSRWISVRCGVGKDEAFEERVRRQSVGSVKARTGDFSSGEQVWEGRFPRPRLVRTPPQV